MKLFVPVRRATLLVPSGPHHDPDRKHLFILLTDPQPPDQLTLLVSVSSVPGNLPHDSTCLLYSGDHGFIRHPSYVNYARSRIEPAQKLLDGVHSGVLVPQGALDTGIFARVCQGLLESRHTAPKIRNFFNSAQRTL